MRAPETIGVEILEDFRSPEDVRDPATRVKEGSMKGQGRVGEGSRKGQGRVGEGAIHIDRFDDPLGEHLIKKER